MNRTEEVMEFGDKEWFRRLNNILTFPSKVVFYLDKDHNIITTRAVQSKAKVQNVRYEDIRPSINYRQSKRTAIIKVKEIFTDKEYHQEMIDLQEEWDTDKY